MKKIFSMLIYVMTVLNVFAWPHVVIDKIRYEIRNDSYAIAYYPADKNDVIEGDIVIRDYVESDGSSYPVTVVGDIKVQSPGQKLCMPETIREIWCGMAPVTIDVLPDGLEHVSVYALSAAYLPQEIYLPSIKDLAPFSFNGNVYGVENIRIGSDLNALGEYAFIYSNVKNIEFEDGVCGDTQPRLFSNYAFSGINNIEELKLPKYEGLKLGDCVVQWCENLKRVIFPDVRQYVYGYCSRYSIEEYMIMYVPVYGYFFKDCPKLKEIVCMGEIPIEITNIDNFKEKNQWVENTAEEFTFMDNIDECVLKVPAGSEALYRAHPVWGRFQTILGFENGDYDLVSINSVEADKDATPVYYNLQGIQVKEPVKGQLYIRKAGAETTKMVY
jgi:hypothetical protein